MVRSFQLTTNTVQSYSTQVRAFYRIAAQYGLPLDRPLTERELCIALIIYAQYSRSNHVRGIRVRTIGLPQAQV